MAENEVYERYTVLGGTRYPKVVKLDLASDTANNRYSDIRGGLSWHTDMSPLYVCILGLPAADRYSSVKEPAFYHLLYEETFGGFDSGQRFRRLGDIASLYCCNYWVDFYNERYEAQRDTYLDYERRHHWKYGQLEVAPYCGPGQFRVGLELAKTWITEHNLDIPQGTTCFEQLSRIQVEDLQDSKVAERFYAINGLRLVCSSFQRDPYREQETFPEFVPHQGNPEGWMY